MKRIILFFTVCLGLSVSATTFADDADVVRAATKRTNSGNTASINATNTPHRNTMPKAKNESARNENARAASKTPRSSQVSQSRTATTNTLVVKQRPKTENTKEVTSRAATNTKKSAVARTANVSARKTPIKTTASRTAAYPSNVSHSSRAATLNDEKISNIKSKDFSKCKTVYYECMDEFCANKDTDLRRCACSSRIHEFDKIKKQLGEVEDKMLDFNQRLLTVSMDKEDAAAINTATEGELAFSTKDTSESEKILKRITDSLNNNSNSKLNNNLSPISLSLNMDTAWDSVDSMAGVSTTTKSGLDLYNAAMPVCVEMAREVCSDEELDIAQSGYKLTIQQDCNTVAKSYSTQYNQAIEKINESGALLDMSRLNVYQQRNSDDMLTCKKKISEQLYDPAVCGKDLYKCLDISGQYIDPSTGEAFLSKDLYNITTLLTEPDANSSWSKMAQNEKFVTFLNSKKIFMKSATEQCQDIADTVWKEFLDEALAKIKLAQNAKLEQVRTSCTTLIAECKTNAQETLSDFDARAISTFSVLADTTVNALCNNIETACISLMNASGGGGADWGDGMTTISANTSYDKIIETCSNVGRNCIIKQCKGASGDFALCKKYSDQQRRSILNRLACWNDVLACVKQSGNLDDIKSKNLSEIISNRENYYKGTYEISDDDDTSDMPVLCGENPDVACLITEQIWGNCEHGPNKTITKNANLIQNDSEHYIASNKILEPKNDSTTILSWFAYNTGTSDSDYNCSVSECPVNYVYANNKCSLLASDTTTDCVNITYAEEKINVTDNITNACREGIKDNYNNCCIDKNTNNGICIDSENNQAILVQTVECDGTNLSYYCPNNSTREIKLYCVGSNVAVVNNLVTCNGRWVLVDEYGNYFNPAELSTAPTMFYNNPTSCPTSNQPKCSYGYNSGWKWTVTNNSGTNNCISTPVPTSEQFLIDY